MKLKLQQK